MPTLGILIVSLGFWSGLFVKATKDKAGIRSMFPVFHRDEIIQQRASEAIAFAEKLWSDSS